MRYLFLFLFFIVTSAANAAEPNAGFVQGIWYSTDTVFANVPTRIYVALRNNTPDDLTGTVRFSDNGKRIGSSYVSTLSGRLVEAWVDWTPTEGAHTITASMSDATLHKLGGSEEALNVADIVAEDSLTVDLDTDGDGTGNTKDPDDDNDGITDEDERARGTNPLVPNPKPEEKKAEEAKPAENHDEPTPIPTTQEERGLERYFGPGTIDGVFANATDRIDSVKTSLDGYRGQRNAELYQPTQPTEPVETTIGSDATITRTQLEPDRSFLESFVSGAAMLLKNVWTFVLWTFSKFLAHPALVEFVGLILLLYFIYRTARRLGRRPGP